MVRCSSCGATQSEWAAQCAACGHDLGDAVSIEPTPVARAGVRIHPVAALALLVALAVVVAAFVASRRGATTASDPAPPVSTSVTQTSPSSPSTTTRTAVGTGISRLNVLAVDPSGDLVRHDQHGQALVATDAAGWPEGPAIVGGHVLYLSGGTVLDATTHTTMFPSLALGRPDRGRPERLTAVVDASARGRGDVWVTSRVGDPAPSEADLLTFDGATWRRTTSVTLPANEVAVAAFPGRLVTIVIGGGPPPPDTDHQRLSIVERDSATGTEVLRLDGAITGQASPGYLIGATPDVLAYVDCAERDCPLVVRTASGTRRVRPPSGLGPFLPAGAVSPDGSIVVFARRDRLLARVVVVDAHADATTVVDGDVTSGDPAGAAAWSPDGHFLVFGGFAETYIVDASRQVTRLPYVAGYGFIVTSP